MTMKFVTIHAPTSHSKLAWLTNFFTKSTNYHCGFLDEETQTFYDMHLLPRKTVWPRYKKPVWYRVYNASNLSREDCEEFLRLDSRQSYGFMDYFLFVLRPIYHFFGKSTRNAKGMICSEMCRLWLRRKNYNVLPDMEVPAPVHLEVWADQFLEFVGEFQGM